MPLLRDRERPGRFIEGGTRMRVGIVTDSNSGISVAQGAQLGIFVVPMPLLVDGEIRYEGVDLTSEEFYAAQLAGRDVSTSQPSPGDVMDLWDRVLEEYDQLVYIPMSSGLSASCQTAQGLSESYDGKVEVADLRRISVTQQLAVLDAVELAKLGLTAREIREELDRVAMDAMIYIGVETLTYLRRGGRVTPAAAAMGNLLNIKPLLKIYGERLDAFAKVRGVKACKQRAVEALRESVEEFQSEGWNFVVGTAHTYRTQEEIQDWQRTLEENFPGIPAYHGELALSVGCHTGPGAFGMGVVRRVDLPKK